MNNGESSVMQSSEATLGESRGTHNRKSTEAWNFGSPTHVCEHCGAQVWYEERTI